MKMNMNEKYESILHPLEKTAFVPLLIIRAMATYGMAVHYLVPWMLTLSINDSSFNTAFEVSIKTLVIAMLILGLATRLISSLLIVYLVILIGIILWSGSFTAFAKETELLLCYIGMLMLLVWFGAGRLSMDYWISRNWARKFQKPIDKTEIKQGEFLLDFRWQNSEDF